jgi:tetratricopeptide (TPR) repeat protein
MRMCEMAGAVVFGAILSVGATGLAGQTANPLGTPSPSAPEEAAKRDALLEPGLQALKAGDAAGAVAAFQSALKAFPNDLQVLTDSAEAALFAHQDEAALGFFQRALAQHPDDPWHLRLGMMLAEARLQRWEAFEKDLTALKAAKQGGDRELQASTGFIVDAFEANGVSVQVVYYPLLAGHFYTLYRFLLPKAATQQEPVASQGQSADRCKNPNFRPYLDVESDDVDQETFRKEHPELAAKGERSYSLDTYPAPCSQGLIKFYSEGEPRYEMVRWDVEKILSRAAKQ